MKFTFKITKKKQLESIFMSGHQIESLCSYSIQINFEMEIFPAPELFISQMTITFTDWLRFLNISDDSFWKSLLLLLKAKWNFSLFVLEQESKIFVQFQS